MCKHEVIVKNRRWFESTLQLNLLVITYRFESGTVLVGSFNREKVVFDVGLTPTWSLILNRIGEHSGSYLETYLGEDTTLLQRSLPNFYIEA